MFYMQYEQLAYNNIQGVSFRLFNKGRTEYVQWELLYMWHSKVITKLIAASSCMQDCVAGVLHNFTHLAARILNTNAKHLFI